MNKRICSNTCLSELNLRIAAASVFFAAHRLNVKVVAFAKIHYVIVGIDRCAIKLSRVVMYGNAFLTFESRVITGPGSNLAHLSFV